MSLRLQDMTLLRAYWEDSKVIPQYRTCLFRQQSDTEQRVINDTKSSNNWKTQRQLNSYIIHTYILVHNICRALQIEFQTAKSRNVTIPIATATETMSTTFDIVDWHCVSISRLCAVTFFGNNHNENVENVKHTVYVRLRIRNVIIRIAVQHSDVMSRHLPQQMLQAPELGIYKSTRTVKTYHQGQSGSNPESGSGTLPEFDTDFLVHW